MKRLLRTVFIALIIMCPAQVISSGEDNNEKLNEDLLAASLQGNISEVRKLLKLGADVNAIGKFKSRPLHLASSSNRDLPEIVKLLIQAGAELNPQNSHGQAPLHLAVLYRRPESIKILLASGADPDVKDKEGKFPCDYTFKEGYKSIYLLFRHPKKEKSGETASRPPIIPEEKEVPQHGDPFTNSAKMDFVYIKPGTFIMGSPPADSHKMSNENQHQVTITKGFFMQTTEVTQGQWRKVMGGKPPKYRNRGYNYPVAHVTWNESQMFIEKLNRLDKSIIYRLPTEAEWEYACRAGTQTSNPWNVAKDQICDYANVADRTADKKMFGIDVHQCRDDFVYTAPVRTFKPNGFGLYDMIGNVWEWCQDYHGPYPSEPVIDPMGPSSGKKRVIRGCGWSGKYKECRSAYRGSGRPGETGWGLGFRVVATKLDQ